MTMTEKNEYYLRRIIELSKENGFELLLINVPSIQALKSEDEQKAYNTVAQIAEGNQIRFIDYNEKAHRDAMGLDLAVDTINSGHLNSSGAKKLSSYMAEFLKAEYNLPDRRNDERYKSWEESANGYFRYEAMEKAKLCADLPSYIDALKDVSRELIFITSVKDEASAKIGAVSDALPYFGVTEDLADKYQHSYISVYEVSSGYLYEAVSPKSQKKDVFKDELPVNIEVFSGGYNSGNMASIKIDGQEQAKNQRGLNIVIFDKVLETVFDSFYVDTYEDDTYAIMR